GTWDIRERVPRGVAAKRQGNWQPHARDVNRYAYDYIVQRERLRTDRGQRDHDELHEEVDRHAVGRTRDHGVLQQEGQAATRQVVKGGGRGRDTKVAQESQPGGQEPAGEGVAAQYAAGDALEHRHGARDVRVHHDGRGDVEQTGQQACPQDRRHCVRPRNHVHARAIMRSERAAVAQDRTVPSSFDGTTGTLLSYEGERGALPYLM